MIRQIPRGLSHLADAAARAWRSLNPPTVTLLFYKVTLAVLDATNRQPVSCQLCKSSSQGKSPTQAN
jgi:hypothetical protein